MTHIFKPLNLLFRQARNVENPLYKDKFAPVNHEHPEYVKQGAILDNVDVPIDDLAVALADHNHDNIYLTPDATATATYMLQGQASSAFSLKEHEHPEYVKK